MIGLLRRKKGSGGRIGKALVILPIAAFVIYITVTKRWPKVIAAFQGAGQLGTKIPAKAKPVGKKTK